MTITLSKDEFQTFENRLSAWYADQTIFIIERLQLPDFGQGLRLRTGKELVLQAQADFCAKHPKPDWRSLL